MRSWLPGAVIPIAVALAVGLLITVLNLAHPSQPPIEVRAMQPVPTPTVVLYVHVDGAVVTPGVYALQPGGRVFEAIDAAGGATDEADLRELNLAAKIADGQKLVIPTQRTGSQEVEPPTLSASIPQSSGTGATIGLNTATQRMLESLPGVGPVTAGKIITRRTTTGPFTKVEQLRDEKIMNAPTYERVKALVSTD